MGILSNQFANVVEWEEFSDELIFWKWKNREIKKGSRLIIRPGQDAIFLYQGKIEGVFKEDGTYDIETKIIPFLSTLKGFKFGFNSGMRAEVLFVNTKEFTIKWGTKGPIMLQAPGLPGGLPIRANGTANVKVSDYATLIDKVAGIKDSYSIEDVKLRIITILDQLLMKHISQEGKDMFNLQASAIDISRGIQEDLDMETSKDGISVTGFSINNFNYPQEVQDAINKNAAQSMVGNVGANMANQMMGQMNNNAAMNQQAAPQQAAPQQGTPAQGAGGSAPKFCPECGTPTNGAKFCPECGTKLI